MIKKFKRVLMFSMVSLNLLLISGPVMGEKVLKIIPHADLKNLDPIWTTAYITRNHGYYTVCKTAAEAFFKAYYLKQACSVQIKNLSKNINMKARAIPNAKFKPIPPLLLKDDTETANNVKIKTKLYFFFFVYFWTT